MYFQITWLEGHSLAQTVFTCLYVHNPDLIEEPALKAFALGILKVCDIAREKVNKAAVFEEVRITSRLLLCHSVKISNDDLKTCLHTNICNKTSSFFIIVNRAFVFVLPYNVHIIIRKNVSLQFNLHLPVGGFSGHDIWLQDGQQRHRSEGDR